MKVSYTFSPVKYLIIIIKAQQLTFQQKKNNYASQDNNMVFESYYSLWKLLCLTIKICVVTQTNMKPYYRHLYNIRHTGTEQFPSVHYVSKFQINKVCHQYTITV